MLNTIFNNDQPQIEPDAEDGNSSRQPLKVHHLSHDLRGPLNSILGFTELLLEGIEGPINDIQSEDLTAIRQSAKNLLRLINNMVDLSRLADDRLILNSEAVDLNAAINKVISDIQSGPEIITNLPATLPPVRGDSERVEQMVASLINYACKINPQGKITVGVKHDDTQALAQVVVNNVWLPSKQIEELFELAVHIDAAGRSELGAGGLDLPLTLHLAQKHQGQAWVENQDQIGAIFFLKLPIHQQRQAENTD